jgi:hypothetical protein
MPLILEKRGPETTAIDPLVHRHFFIRRLSDPFSIQSKLRQSLLCRRPIAMKMFQIQPRATRRAQSALAHSVMPGLVPGIHVFLRVALQARRGWPGQARP